MNVKCTLIGAIVFFVVTTAIGVGVTGPTIHEGVLDPVYKEHQSFWRPELNQEPPDIGALMPMWMINGFLVSLIVAGLYCCFGGCLKGGAWLRGAKFCLCLAIFGCGITLSYAGVFNLPWAIWIWWCVDFVIIYLIGGAVMGWAVGKWGGGGAAEAA